MNKENQNNFQEMIRILIAASDDCSIKIDEDNAKYIWGCMERHQDTLYKAPQDVQEEPTGTDIMWRCSGCYLTSRVNIGNHLRDTDNPNSICYGPWLKETSKKPTSPTALVQENLRREPLPNEIWVCSTSRQYFHESEVTDYCCVGKLVRYVSKSSHEALVEAAKEIVSFINSKGWLPAPDCEIEADELQAKLEQALSNASGEKASKE